MFFGDGSMTAFVAFLAGALLGQYVLLRILMYGCRRVRKRPNESAQIATLGILTLGITTVLGGYGMQDGGPSPQFLAAFSSYFGPAMAATVIELLRLDARDPALRETVNVPDQKSQDELIDHNDIRESRAGDWVFKHWLRELINYLLTQARYEREAVEMDAIDQEKLTEFFGCPREEIDTDKVALSEWEQVIPWNNMPRLGATHRAKFLDDLAVYVIGMALGNHPDLPQDFVNEMFEDQKESQQRLFRENMDKYRQHGQSP